MSIWQIVELVFFGACWVYSLYSIGQSKRIIAEKNISNVEGEE